MDNLKQEGTDRMDQLSPSKVKAPNFTVTGGSFGRVKAPPVCKGELKKESHSSAHLSKICFSLKDAALLGSVPSIPREYLSSSPSENASKGSEKGTENSAKTTSNNNRPLNEMETSWEAVRRIILNFQTSRSGRECQRFAGDAQTGQYFRLTTGTVPIMSDGRILLCSSSRKESWILPKGGWESDESLGLGALRETFEEAGVLGFLGPELTSVEYETRKGKKRRLEMKLQKKKEARKSGAELSVVSASSSCGISSDDEHVSGKSIPSGTSKESSDKSASASPSGTATNAIMHSIFDDSASVASIASVSSDMSSSCTHCRMQMIPLYVTEVKDHWPESGRCRKVVHIDEAIEIMSNRPEFQAVLREVKRKGYHLAGTEGNRISLGSIDGLSKNIEN